MLSHLITLPWAEELQLLLPGSSQDQGPSLAIKVLQISGNTDLHGLTHWSCHSAEGHSASSSSDATRPGRKHGRVAQDSIGTHQVPARFLPPAVHRDPNPFFGSRTACTDSTNQIQAVLLRLKDNFILCWTEHLDISTQCQLLTGWDLLRLSLNRSWVLQSR